MISKCSQGAEGREVSWSRIMLVGWVWLWHKEEVSLPPVVGDPLHSLSSSMHAFLLALQKVSKLRHELPCEMDVFWEGLMLLWAIILSWGVGRDCSAKTSFWYKPLILDRVKCQLSVLLRCSDPCVQCSCAGVAQSHGDGAFTLEAGASSKSFSMCCQNLTSCRRREQGIGCAKQTYPAGSALGFKPPALCLGRFFVISPKCVEEVIKPIIHNWLQYGCGGWQPWRFYPSLRNCLQLLFRISLSNPSLPSMAPCGSEFCG